MRNFTVITHLGHRLQPRIRVGAMASEPRSSRGASRDAPPDVTDLAYSFVIPVKDERATLPELYQRIAREMGDESFEVIFVDDGSRDGSWQVIRALRDREPGRVRGLRFRRNSGKAAALTAGFRAARGGIVFTLDADLQDDPKEIPRFLAKIAEGHDLVSGWKKLRHDPWHKVLPSRVFNRMLSRISGVDLHDHNCGFKCYRAEVAKSLTLFGELHRMVPALSAMEGYKVAEIVVEHHPRRHGKSKYGFERYLRGFTDMLVVGFLRRFRDRPSHFLAGIAAGCVLAALSALAATLALALAGFGLAALAAFVAAVVAMGTSILGAIAALLAELINRGGLRTSWKLGIVEDTALDERASGDQTPAPRAVPSGFLVQH